MPWRPLPEIAFGVCIYPFQPAGSAELPLHIGDELYMVEQGGKDGSWYRGYLVAPPSVLAGLTSTQGQTLEARVFSGIFPRCCVEIRELLADGERSGSDTVAETGSRPADKASLAPSHGPITALGNVSTDARASQAAGRIKSTYRLDSPTTDNSPFILTAQTLTSKGLRLTNRISTNTVGSDGRDASLPALPVATTRPPAPLPALKIGDETQCSSEEPLVDEIASCLREWYTAKLHELLLNRQYTTLGQMDVLIQRLDGVRRQLLHLLLTDQELRALRKQTVWDLVAGNKLVCGEVIVRSPSQNGRILTADDSPIELTRLQSVMSLLDEEPVQTPDEHLPYHLLVHFPESFGQLSAPKTIAVHLCIKPLNAPLRPISEVHAINISANTCSPSDSCMSTLFTNISATDIGEGSGAGSILYAVFKVNVSEALRTAGVASPGTDTPTSRSSSTQHTSIKGRRSLMWARSTTPIAFPRSASVASENKLSLEQIDQTQRTTKSDRLVKRTVAAAVIPVHHLLRGDVEREQDLTFWMSATSPQEEYLEDQSNLDQVLRELLPSCTGRYKKYSFPKPVRIFLKPFIDPDPDALIKRTPTLLQHVSQTRKIGFFGAPRRSRSDIYLTLSDAIIPRQAFLSHPKSGTVPLGPQHGLANLQLTLEVRRSNGQRIENCIYPSSNSQAHTAWRTTACERGEPWDLTIRLAIRPDDVPGSHIVMSIADLPGFPFALCWMPLWNDGAFIEDGQHFLSLYQYDEYTSSTISGRGAYLALPWSFARKDGPQNASLARLQVQTFLCSTKYSQNPTLLGVLKWENQPSGTLPGLLKRFNFVPEIEVVKLLPEVLDNLFEILVETQGSEEYEHLVFNSLVFVLGIVHDRRFNLTPLVDSYAESRFRYPAAGLCLVKTLIRLLINPTDVETSQSLRAAFKVGKYLFKFINRAWSQQERADLTNNDHRGPRKKAAFLRDVTDVFGSLQSLMKNPDPILIGAKTLVVQHFPSWLPEITAILPPQGILQTAFDFVDSCKDVKGKLVLYKLILIMNIDQSATIASPQLRKKFRINTVRWLSDYWGKTDESDEQWKEQVRLCCSVVASQLSQLGEEGSDYMPRLIDSYRIIQLSERPVKNKLSLLFPTSYPFPSRPIPETSDFDEALAEIAAVLAGVTSLPTIIHLDMPQSDLAEFLFSAFNVYISILSGEAYPHSWLSVHIFHQKSTMRSLEKLSSILIDSFLPHPDDAEDFNKALWQTFFEALLKLVGSEALALETFPEQKRRAVWKIAGDVREQGAELLRRTWESIGWETSPEDKAKHGFEKLGGYQVQFVPSLVSPVIELCLSVHDSLRHIAIQVLQTMLISEWSLNHDLSLPEAEIIGCLDSLFKGKHLSDNLMQKQFLGELLDLFQPLAAADPEDELFHAVTTLVSIMNELLDHLIAVHGAEVSSDAVRLVQTLHFLEFLKNTQKIDIFISYVHNLADMQSQARNFTEAGLSLRLHADLYDWDPSTIAEPLYEPSFPPQTVFERKEQLYLQMIKFYEDGQSWDNALGSYMELADQYEHSTFDFAKLARVQRAMATIYETIAHGQRENPRYFRVVFSGLGFPPNLRDKQFIYQGLPSDRMASFLDRMHQAYPSAQIQTSIDGQDHDMEGQYLHAYPVTPQKDIKHPIYRRVKVAQAVRDYYLLSRPNTFTSASRRKPSDTEVNGSNTEKTVYTTAEPFPTILKSSAIMQVDIITLSPLHSAIERTTRKTAELVALDNRLTAGDDASTRENLTKALELAVDANNPSTAANYRHLLELKSDVKSTPDEDYEIESKSQASSADGESFDDEVEYLDLHQEALKNALIDHAFTIKSCLSHFSRSAHQATRADLAQQLEETYAPELAALASTDDGHKHALFASPFPNDSLDVSPPIHPGAHSPINAAITQIPAATQNNSADAISPHIDKHRLSLIFGKRAFPAGINNEETVSPDDQNFTVTSESIFATTGLHFETKPVYQNARPNTGHTNSSAGEHTIRSRVGSVKKRLSLLSMNGKSGIGKKSVKTNMLDHITVREEI